MRLSLFFATALAVSISTGTAFAQAGIYALFTGANLDTSSTILNNITTNPPTDSQSTQATKIYGATFGLYADIPTPLVKFGGDVRGSFLTGNDSHLYYGVAGPRLEVDLPFLDLKPYVEGLVGGGQYRTAIDANSPLRFNFVVLAGVDRRIFSFLDWRIIEFSDTHVIIETDTPVKALSTGLVFRIP